MGSYEYFRKIETNGNLLIFCQTNDYIEYFRCKNGDIRDGQNLESKVNFPANSAVSTTFQLFPIKM